MPSSLPALGLFEIRAFKDYPAEIAALTARGFSVQGRPDLPPHPFRLPFDWHADPFGDRNWMFQLHSLRLLDPYLNRLRNEPDHPEAFSAILEIVADWYRDNVLGRPCRFTWYDMSTGLRALRLAFLIMAARKRGIELPHPPLMTDLVDRHLQALADPKRLSPGNHGLFQMNGLMALAWLHPTLPRTDRDRSYATEQMMALLSRQLGPEAIHTEDAPYYHFFATKKITRILAAPWWRVPQMKSVRKKLARAEAAFDWLTDPAGRCVPIGDSSESVMSTQQPQVLEKWPHTRTGAYLGAVLDGYGVIRSAPEVPLVEATMLFLTASFHVHGHKHSDCLSLVWQEGGANILIDSGKYGYERDAMRDYFISRRAHNTVEIDTEDFSRTRAHAYGSGMRRVAPLGCAWLMDAEADRRHLGVLHRRCVIFRPGRFVLAVDHITAAADPSLLHLRAARAFTSWWHFAPGLAPEQEATCDIWRVSGLSEGRSLRVSHVTAAEGLRSARHQGEMVPRAQGWVSEAYLEYRPAPVLGFAVRTGAGYFAATLLEIVARGAEPELALEWRPADATITLGSVALPGQAMRSFRFGEFALEAGDALL